MSRSRDNLTVTVCLAVLLLVLLYNRCTHLQPQQTYHELDENPGQRLTETRELERLNAAYEVQRGRHPSSSKSRLPGRRCSMTKVSMLYGGHKFPQLEGALDSHRRHSERWGCGFEALDSDVTTRKLYSKHYFLMSVMLQELSKPVEKRQKWLMWVDADSILLNPALSPELFLPPDQFPDIYALVVADHHGLNNGIFYLRVHPAALDLLSLTVAYPLTHPDEDLGWFGEQAAMSNVIKALESGSEKSRPYPGIVWVPRMWFNAYEFEHAFEGEPGHMIVHFAGLAETRISHMANWLDELAQNQAKWELPLEDSPYKDAVTEFWAEFSANATKRT